jgi:hypothetical protein
VRREAAGSRLSSSSAAGKYLCIARLSWRAPRPVWQHGGVE